MDRNRATTYLLLTASMALWGGTWVVGRILAQDMHPMNAAFLRFVLASAFLTLMCLRTTGRLPRLTLREFPAVFLLGASGVFLYNYFFFTGLKTVAAGRAALIVACIPVCVSALSALLHKERFGPARILGTLLSLGGVALVISNGDLPALASGGVSRGDLMILGCVAAWTAYSLGGRAAMRTMDPVHTVTWSCILGALMLLPAALAAHLIRDFTRISLPQWLGLAYLGILATGLAYAWYYKAIHTLGASRAAIFINLVPVFALTLGCLLLAEPLHASLATGGALVITGVWLTNRP